jgi:hypothetical protein
MKHKLIITIASLVFALSLGQEIKAEESTLEKVETTKNKAIDSAKRAYREIDDKICETVNGKTNCVAKKLTNKIKNTSDKAKTDTTELINKVD